MFFSLQPYRPGIQKAPRPRFVRHATEPSQCHPTQALRASLQDTKGAVYIPVPDDKSRENWTGFLDTQCYCYGMARLRSKSENETEQLRQTTAEAGSKTIQPSVSDLVCTSLDYNEDSSAKDTRLQPLSLKRGEIEAVLLKDGAARSTGCTKIRKPLPSESLHNNIPRLFVDWEGNDGASDHLNSGKPQPTLKCSSSIDELGGQHLPAKFLRLSTVRFRSQHDLRSQALYKEVSSATFRNPFGVENNLRSRRTSSSSDLSRYLRPNAFSGHRDTLARIKRRRSSTVTYETASSPSESSSSTVHIHPVLFIGHRGMYGFNVIGNRASAYLPRQILTRIIRYLTFDDYKTLRLTCKMWLDCLAPPKFPPSYRLPEEILQHVYLYLDPEDFDAARHTCQSWFLASLDITLEKAMLRKADCWRAGLADIVIQQEVLETKQQAVDVRLWNDHGEAEISDCHGVDLREIVSEEWLLSKRLATEARISPRWRGISSKSSEPETTPLSLIQVFEFWHSELHKPSWERNSQCATKSFAVSACRRYLLHVTGSHIVVYNFSTSPPFLEPVTELECPRNVLSVSMDTTSGRYAVGALLEGRMGMCWDLVQDDNHTDFKSNPEVSTDKEMQLSASLQNLRSGRSEKKKLQSSELIESHFEIPADCDTVSSAGSLDENFHLQGHSPKINSEAQPTTIYHNLGSVDDLPRSVAMCPQRQCIAFGCGMGVELHWVDAVTGKDLNRWFPLAAPSNYLYFLPQLPGDESSKKLRLISSAAAPGSTEVTNRAATPSRWNYSTHVTEGSRRQSMTRLFFGSIPFPNVSNLLPNILPQPLWNTPDGRQEVLRTVDCDHYRALPLSDGVHMLFTDPKTHLVCMGSDAPLGGQTKLIRKVILLPPHAMEPESSSSLRPTPICYAAGQDLTWGIRIVVAYDDGTLVLYNITSDTYERVRRLRATSDVWGENTGILSQSDLEIDISVEEQEDIHYHANTSTEPAAGNNAARERSSSSWNIFSDSLRIDGVVFANLDQVVEDLAVNTGHGGLRVWTFSANGVAKMWDLDKRNRVDAVQHLNVDQNGTIYEAEKEQWAHPAEGDRQELLSKRKGKEREWAEEADGMQVPWNGMHCQ